MTDKLTGLCTLLVASLVVGSAAAEVPGIRDSKPDEGPFVEVDGRFLVPYTMKIPGTSAEFTMIPIPGGKARIGNPDHLADERPEEGPVFTVEVAPFWIGQYEVTWAEYQKYMRMYSIFKRLPNPPQQTADGGIPTDAVTAPTELYDPSFTYLYGQDPQLPAVTMTQFAAKQYTKWLSGISGQQFRLPTEAEWEYACRAGTDTPFSFGSDPEQLAQYGWFYDNADEKPHQVGQKKPNPWGLYDMHGNVWEWVIDQYADDGYARLNGKTVGWKDAINWATEAYPRVVRGGSWDDDAIDCRSASKLGSHDEDWKVEDPNLPLSPWWFTSDPSRAVGFRIVRSYQPLSDELMAKFWEPDVQDIKDDVANRLIEGRGALGHPNPELVEAIKELDK